MAGEAALSALLQVVFQNLASPILSEIGLRWGVHEKLDDLRTTVAGIQRVLNNAELRQINDEAVRMWVRDLKDVAYDADDILDEIATDANQRQIDDDNGSHQSKQAKQVSHPSFATNSSISVSNIPHSINKIMLRLDAIAKKRDHLYLKEVNGGWQHEIERPETSSLVDKSYVFGRQDEQKKIISLLISQESMKMNVSVISIVGMGGLGKTTLAQLVYNDERVQEHFELLIWVCVSEDFDVRRLTKAIIESAIRQTSDLLNLDPLQANLRDILRRKRFLLVLDDVWNENENDWDRLRLPFNVGAKGSKIIVTTRSEKVSSIMSVIPTLRLENLSDDDCWSLFSQRAFVGGNSDVQPNLVPIGKEIVKRCRGLPLAAKTLGGLLRSKTCKREWDAILQSHLWDLPTDKNDILPALRLSYHHLPACLKQCFAYCSVFPKDYKFQKHELVKLWIAEGFIQTMGMKQMEDIGYDYFDDLLLRSFFQHSHIDPLSNKESIFIMHDLIHDLAQFIANDESAIVDNYDSYNKISKRTRRLSLLSGADLEPISRASDGLRTFLSLQKIYTGINYLDLFSKTSRLRVLNLSNTNIERLPDNLIGVMKHLRYLDLSGTEISLVPDKIFRLYNLQTLRLYNCRNLLSISRGICKLRNLRHLELDEGRIQLPRGIGKLTCLQTLPTLNLDGEPSIGDLKDMVNLRGMLHISKLDHVVKMEEAKEADLKNKPNIDMLKLEYSDHVGRRRDKGAEEEVLEGLQPHMNLKHLDIRGYGGETFPSWIGNPLFSNISEVRLSYCIRSENLPPLGQLPLLKCLYIFGMRGVKRVSREFCGNGAIKGFPLLEVLQFNDMPNWEEWSGVQEGHFPCLGQLSIEDCPKMIASLRFPSLSKLLLSECHETALSWVPYHTSLTMLTISHFKSLESLSQGSVQPLTMLKEMNISHCYELNSLPKGELQDLHFLHRLTINNCPKLSSFPEEGLPTMLKELEICDCDNFISQPKVLPVTLEHLVIISCFNLLSLPETLPPSLKFFKISSCYDLMTLFEGMRSLASLKDLIIENCRGLSSLPANGLPITLQDLSISGCPLLKERCQRERGDDWSKIANIPTIWID